MTRSACDAASIALNVPGGRGGSTWPSRAAYLALRAPAMALQAVDGTAAARGEVTAFGEDDQSVPVSQPRGEVADQGDRLVAVPAGVDEAVRDPYPAVV